MYPALLVPGFIALVGAQILPTSFVQPIFSQPKASIEGYTWESYKSLLSSYAKEGNGKSWVDENAWTAVAQYNLQRKKRVFYNNVKAAQDEYAGITSDQQPWKTALVNYYNDDIGWAALSHIAAYDAYGDQIFLDRAKGAYEFILNHGFISSDIVKTGYLKGTKNPDNKIQASCGGKSMIGGVYWVNGNNPPGDQLNAAAHDAVNSVSTGTFALLGTELCRVTSDRKYCDTSYLNVWWLDRHMVTPEGFLWDHLSGQKCAVVDWRFTYNQGLYFAAYAALGRLTGNATAMNIAKESIKKAIGSLAPWNTKSGWIDEGSGDATQTDDAIEFKAIMIRYLHRTVGWFNDNELTKAVTGYNNIQYYALTQLNSDNKEHPVRYGRNWPGPYAQSTTQAHVAALDVLSALELNPDSAYPKSKTGGVMTVEKQKPPVVAAKTCRKKS